MSGTITSSPFPIPKAFNDKCKAEVALETPIANFAPVNFAKFFSNSLNFGPSVNRVESRADNTAFLSSFVMEGEKKGILIEELKASLIFDKSRVM
jgi:hypothetical protein